MPRAWIPRPLPTERVLGLGLSPHDGYVLSRIDGITDVDQLGLVTGLDPEELRAILARLLGAGAIEPPETSGSAPGPAPGPGGDATHRQLFESRLHSLPQDQRERLAAEAEDPDLSALCFDPVPSVIQRVLENPKTGLAQARLIAAQHRNPVGLEALSARASFLADREVQRLLLRNSQSPDSVVRRLLTSRRLAEVYDSCQSHELPERHRHTARAVLRARFGAASPAERVELIVVTEGRALAALSGLALDGRSAALLCGRSLVSMLLVENLARWPATPPPLIAHLLKQPMVRQAPALRQLLQQHPNRPRSAP